MPPKHQPSAFKTWFTLALATPSILTSANRNQYGNDYRYTERQRQEHSQERKWEDSFPPDPPRYSPYPPKLQQRRRMGNGPPQRRRNSEFDDIRNEEGARGGRLTEEATMSSDGDMKSWSGKLRKDLLTNYDRGAYPWEHVWRQSGWAPPGERRTNILDADESDNSRELMRKGVPIKVGINYHRVFAVDIENAVADVVVWFRMSWEDPRLTWNPEDYGGIERVWFWIHEGSGPGGETSEIWTPDLELWNQETSLTKSLADANAAVDFDGGVWWSRPGHMRAVCNFEGLDKFPFDLLTCTAEVGSWAYSGLYMRPTLMDEGFSIGGSDTAGEAYAEYKLEDVVAIEHLYPPYPAAPEEDWPVLKHTIRFRRAWQPYIRGYLLLQVILNLAAMACFWLPPHCGERMTLSITALLASVASDLVVSSKLPSASEMTWVSSFSIMSLIFGALSLFESAIVIYFYYLTVDNLIPNWVVWIRKKIRREKKNTPDKSTREKKVRENSTSSSSEAINRDDTNGMLNEAGSDESKNSNKKIPGSSLRQGRYSITESKTTENSLVTGVELSSPKGEGRNGVSFRGSEESPPRTKRSKSLPLDEERGRYESEDCSNEGANVDSDSDDYEDEQSDYVENMPTFRRGSLHQAPPLTRGLSMYSRGQIMPRRSKSIKKMVDEVEQRMFKHSLTGSTRTGIKTILGRDADDFKNAREMENNLRWQRIADLLDESSRVIFPLAYAIALAALLGPVEFL